MGPFRRGDIIARKPRDSVVIPVAPTKGNELVRYYRDSNKLLAAIPHNDKLVGLPQEPFVGELSYSDLIRIFKRQWRWFTRPEKKIVEHLVEYLAFKLARTGTLHEVPKSQPKPVTTAKPEGCNNG